MSEMNPYIMDRLIDNCEMAIEKETMSFLAGRAVSQLLADMRACQRQWDKDYTRYARAGAAEGAVS